MNIGHSFLSCAILQVAGVYGDGRKIPGGVEYRTQFRKGRYLNPVQTEVGKDYGAFAGLRDWFRGGEQRHPPVSLPTATFERQSAFPEHADEPVLTWLGHSSALLQIDGVRVAIDPVLSMDVSPVPHLYSLRRFQDAPPVLPVEIPALDVVFITHDHYDHLDKKSVRALKDKTGLFVVPKGVGARLRRFGVDAARIREMEWWQEDALVTPAGHRLHFACTPARHFSGRGLRDHNKTLWASWVLQGRKHKVFHSGDSGYGSHFRQIGQAFGPFDLVLMENGQYSRHWKDIHMTPEQSVRAAMDLGALYCVPIHWGGFSLSTHDWWEPVERAQVAAMRAGLDLATPRVGESLALSSLNRTGAWWRLFRPMSAESQPLPLELPAA